MTYFTPQSKSDLCHHVDPFWGVDGGGNCLCGPYLPLGIARPGPDTEIPQATSGYRSGEPLMYFAQNHVSGTGGGGRFGNLGIMPYVGRSRRYPGSQEITDEHAEVGLYQATLQPSGVKAGLSCTHQCAVYQFDFPAGQGANLRLDLSAAIRVEVSDHQWLGYAVPKSIGGRLDIDSDREITGRADIRGGWGTPGPYSVYFCLRVNQPMTRRWIMDGAGGYTAHYAEGEGLQFDMGFDVVESLTVQVGISYVSVANARTALEQEATGKTVPELVTTAKSRWNDVFSLIHVEGGTAEKTRLLYNGMYRLFCMPSDRGINHELERWQSGVRHFSELYCLWDSVRNANSLMSLITPDFHRDLLNSLLDTAEHTGWLPDAWITSRHGYAQGGCGADVLFGEAIQKGFTGIDYDRALHFMLKNAEQDPEDTHRQGRRARSDYEQLGYVPIGTKSCLSLTVEYAMQDWSAYQVAKALGKDDVADTCLTRSQGVWALWSDEIKALCPKDDKENFLQDFNPAKPTRPDFWNDPYCYEGTSLEWSSCIHNDLPGWIERLGGPDALEQYLDDFFATNLYCWKEIILHTPCLYLYTNAPHKASLANRKLLDEKYNLSRKGLPDNEDMGSHASFVICSLIGLYPQMGQDRYYVLAPHFDRSEISLGEKTLVISAPGASDGKCIVEKIIFNGDVLTNPWLSHGVITGGGELTIELA